MDSYNSIRQLRKFNNFTQQEFSDLLGMSVRNYREKEIGKSPFTQLEIMKITKLFDLKQDQLFQIFYINGYTCSFWLNDRSNCN